MAGRSGGKGRGRRVSRAAGTDAADARPSRLHLWLWVLGLAALVGVLFLGGRIAMDWRNAPPLADAAIEESRRVRESIAPISLREMLAQDPAERDVPPGAGAPTRAAAGPSYLYSVETWRQGEKLEGIRAELALRGFAVELVAVQGRRKTFRLRLGPLHSASERNNARQELAKLGIGSSAQIPENSG